MGNKKVAKKVARKKKAMKVMVAIPNQNQVSAHMARFIPEMMLDAAMKRTFDITLYFSKVTCVDYNRNTIVKNFLDTECEWLLMMDEDNVPLKNPLELITENKDIIICPTLMFKTTSGKPAINYNVFMKNGRMWKNIWMTDPKVKAHQVDAGGTGCILIHRRVLENLEAPFKSKLNKQGFRDVGSDLYFCQRAKKKGYEVWVYWDYACSHYKEIDLNDVARLVLNAKNIGEEVDMKLVTKQ